MTARALPHRRGRVSLRVRTAIALLGVAALLAAAAAGAGRWLVAAIGAALALAGVLALGMLERTSGEDEPSQPDLTDELTGLANATQLRQDIEQRSRQESSSSHMTLILLALEGFKRYNDSYGHACGDALLAWLARKLRAAIGSRGRVYRLGGGEFVVTVELGEEGSTEVRGAAEAALSEAGDGFVIWCSSGEATVPTEALTAGEALKLADRRTHAHRRRTYAYGPGEESAQEPETPVEALRFVRPRYDVARLATAVGRRMGITGSDLEQLEVAAQLRDVGNMAIPSAILARAGKLAEHEWRFLVLHTLVGERLLAANFGMEDVAALVRSSHERWDGRGYPDGLVGSEIPVGSRIVFVCAAFQDMTSERSYRDALTAAAALKELDASAGAQFDPEVVAAFREQFEDAQEHVSANGRPKPWRPMRVLVAEDDPASRFLLQRAVEDGGHECIAAEDGMQAWEIVRDQHPEVVVSDWAMPRMDGDELCRRIREDPDAPYTYFVMLTAIEGKEYVLRGMQAGVDDFLAKPLDRQELEMRLIAASRVTALHRRLKEQQQVIQAEIDLAATVQRGLLPAAPPVLAGVELAGRCVPAANVGGDYFDYLIDGQGRVILILADVAGHSISSALLMAMARSSLRRELDGAATPAELIDLTNRALFADLVHAELFITAFCAWYDPTTHRLQFANAGHNCPLVRRGSDGSVLELHAEGAALGILEDGGYEQQELQLEPDDMLLIYTDGVVEAAGVDLQQLGDERLAAVVAGCDGDSATELVDRVFGAVREYMGPRPQQDDLTVLALKALT